MENHGPVCIVCREGPTAKIQRFKATRFASRRAILALPSNDCHWDTARIEDDDRIDRTHSGTFLNGMSGAES